MGKILLLFYVCIFQHYRNITKLDVSKYLLGKYLDNYFRLKKNHRVNIKIHRFFEEWDKRLHTIYCPILHNN